MNHMKDTPILFPGLQGKTCLVTGGAGVLGASICEGLALAGVKLAILDLNGVAAEVLATRLQEKTGTTVLGIEGNVLSRASLEQAREKIYQHLGPVDLLINGAGGNSPKATTGIEMLERMPSGDKTSIFDLDLEGIQFVFDLNFTGTLLPVQVFAREMAERGSGTILNISSMAAFRPLTKVAAYSAAKASITNFTQWLAVHLAKTGIRVNAIAPGFFLTEQNRFLLTDQETGQTTPRGQRILDNTPMGRYGDPKDLQGATLFLLSDAAAFITGVILPVDGGYSAFGGV